MNAALNVAKLLVICQKVEGRKKLQKIVHILQSAGYERDFPQHFGYLHYGPYSHEVKADIDLLVDPSGPLVDEAESTTGLGHRTFVYSPTSELEEALSDSIGVPWSEQAKELNAKTPQELEAISTIFFLKRSGVGRDAVLERFTQLKPGLVDKFSEALKAVQSIKSLPASS